MTERTRRSSPRDGDTPQEDATRPQPLDAGRRGASEPWPAPDAAASEAIERATAAVGQDDGKR